MHVYEYCDHGSYGAPNVLGHFSFGKNAANNLVNQMVWLKSILSMLCGIHLFYFKLSLFNFTVVGNVLEKCCFHKKLFLNFTFNLSNEC